MPDPLLEVKDLKVHFNTEAREDGRRLIYGGHVISLARALQFNGMANAAMVAAINAGAHTAPAFAGDTVYAWSEVLDKAETSAPGVGALPRLYISTSRPWPWQGARARPPRYSSIWLRRKCKQASWRRHAPPMASC